MEELAATGLDGEAFAAAWRAEVEAWCVRRGQRPDRPAQPVLPRGVAAAHGPADARRSRSSAGRTTAAGPSTPPGRSSVSRRPRRSYAQRLTLLPSWAGPGSSTLRIEQASVRRAMTAQTRYGAGSPTASASAPPAAGPSHGSERPGRVHEAEGERLGHPGRLGPVGDERDPGGVDGAGREGRAGDAGSRRPGPLSGSRTRARRPRRRTSPMRIG